MKTESDFERWIARDDYEYIIMIKDMISVVIPLYNKEKSIASTLQSVYEQTYTDYEVVIVNDGSTDNSENVVKNFAHIDNRWTLISQENAGVSAARNTGIIAAKGEYIAFLDADDIWAPSYLETLAALINDFPDAGLYSLGYVEIDGDEILKYDNKFATIERGVIVQPWNNKYRIWTGSVAANKERIIKLGLFDTRMTHGEDIDMWWRLILDGGLIVDTTCCAYYRQDAENRAMNKVIPLQKHIPYYIDKYAHARRTNKEFCKFFDQEMIYRLYPYLFDKRYRNEAKQIAKKFDYSLQKRSMHFRMLFPRLYRLFTKR